MILELFLLLSYWNVSLLAQGTRGSQNPECTFISHINSNYSYLINNNLVTDIALNNWLHGDASIILLGEKDNFEDKLKWKAQIKEAYGEFYYRIFLLNIGKKIVRRGTGYMKNPSNIFDKKEVSDIEDKRNLYEGDEIVTLGIIPTSSLSFNIITSFDTRKNLFSVGGLIFDTDMEFLLSRNNNEQLLGYNFSRVFRDIEFHGEISYRRKRKVYLPSDDFIPQAMDNFINLIGISYGHSGPLFLLAEYFYNGFGYNKEEWRDFFNRLGNRDTLALHHYCPPFMRQNYLFLMLKLQELVFIPTVYYLRNIDDNSFYLSFGLEYDISRFTLQIEGYRFFASSNTEFGLVPFMDGITIRGRFNL